MGFITPVSEHFCFKCNRLKLSGEGGQGTKGGPNGDLYVAISVKNHPIFTRENNDVLCEIPISFSQAALGAELITREEVMLQPGETRPFAKKLSVETRFIGVVAAYRNLEQATWRSITAVQPGRTQSITIRAEPLSVSATVSP